MHTILDLQLREARGVFVVGQYGLKMETRELIAYGAAAIAAIFTFYKTVWFPAQQRKSDGKQHRQTDQQEYDQELGRLEWEKQAQDLASKRSREREVENQALDLAKSYGQKMMSFVTDDISNLQQSVDNLTKNLTELARKVDTLADNQIGSDSVSIKKYLEACTAGSLTEALTELKPGIQELVRSILCS